jgi:hypothetical protein
MLVSANDLIFGMRRADLVRVTYLRSVHHEVDGVRRALGCNRTSRLASIASDISVGELTQIHAGSILSPAAEV